VAGPGSRLRLHRDRLTWTLYGWLGTWGWFVFGFGPTVPLLRAEQGTSRTVAALHGTMLAVGAVLAGVLVVALTRRLGRRTVIAAGTATVGVGAALLVSGGGLEVTLPGALLAGTGGSTALNATSPALAEHHGPAGAAAISEGNAAAAAVGVAAPLAVGASVAAGWGWRPGLGVVVVLAAVAAALVHRLPIERALGSGAPRGPRGGGRAPLGGAFWALLGVLSVGVGVEFGTTFWAGDLLQVRLGAAPGQATAAVTGFVAGMAGGRLLAGRLALRVSAPRLVAGALVTAAVGWLLLWTATALVVAVAGLVVCGLGVALLFPLSVAMLIDASRGRGDVASGAGSAAAGCAIGLSPFVLGALADAVGPHRGFLLVPALLAVAAVLLAVSRRAARR
jgi:predicted MFS family arabinose efflux permease